MLVRRPFFFEVVADQFADLAVVVGDQDVIDVFHALGSCAKGVGRSVPSAFALACGSLYCSVSGTGRDTAGRISQRWETHAGYLADVKWLSTGEQHSPPPTCYPGEMP